MVPNDIKPHDSYQIHFVCKIGMKYEISISELTPPPNFSLIPLKIKVDQKLDFDPEKRMMQLQGTSGDIINFIIVLETICDILVHDLILF